LRGIIERGFLYVLVHTQHLQVYTAFMITSEIYIAIYSNYTIGFLKK
jgi:hypothetical protein